MTQPLSSEERFALGQKQRKKMPRLACAVWNVKDRREDPLKLMAASMRGRVPELVTRKYELMAATPFGYFRGAVPVMAYDLSLSGNTGIVNQICGDAHVRNLGAYAGIDGTIVFDVNDFDETTVAPFEWDVKRMAASLVLAGRQTGARRALCRDATAAFLGRYRLAMNELAKLPVLAVARYQVRRLDRVGPIAEIMRLAERATPMHSLEALTVPEGAAQASTEAAKRTGAGKDKRKKKGQKRGMKVGGTKVLDPLDTAKAEALVAKPGRIFKAKPPVLTRMTGAAAQHVVDSLGTYAETLLPERQRFLAQYRPLDVAFKVVGTGSVGLRDYCIYMEGNGPGDPLFLQIKEEAASAYAPYVAGFRGEAAPAVRHQGQRVVEGERAMQLQSDPLLGWTTIQGREYLVRQLNDHKASIEVEALRAAALMEYATVCGEMLARGHARAGDCSMLAGYIGTSERFDEAIGKYAEAYADQTERDCEELRGWLKRGAARTN